MIFFIQTIKNINLSTSIFRYMEEKVEVPNFPGYYVTKEGNVYGLNGKKRALTERNDGYLEVTLNKGKDKSGKIIKKNFLIQRLVAGCFINKTIFDKESQKLVVNHKNGVKTDNNVENLEIVSYSENTKHAHKNKLIKVSVQPVYKIDIKTNKIIEEYSSITEAAKKNSLEVYNISKVCRGKLSSNGGYKWRYIDDIEILHIVENDEWKIIEEFPNYLINREGEVYSKKRKHFLTSVTKKGYKTVGLYDLNSERKQRYVHVLVAEAFILNPKNCPIVNHKDGNKQNSNVENLEWVTYKENSQHACDTGLCPKSKGKAVIKLHKDTLEELGRYETLYEAGLSVDLKQGDTIKMVCDGKRKHAGKHKWKWADK